MNLRELNELRDMRFHIKRLKRRIAEIEGQIYPHGMNADAPSSGIKSHTSKIEQIVERTEKHKLELMKLKNEYEYKVSALESEIYALKDEHIKAILISRFVDARSWIQVAHDIGGGNTADGVRKACFRFFAKR